MQAFFYVCVREKENLKIAFFYFIIYLEKFKMA